jgi:hypothetical protein
MGCADCGMKGGCDARKHVQRGVLDAAIARVYPDRAWGRPDDEARFGAGVGRREAQRLGRAIAEVLRAPTFFRAGGEADLCDFIYVLCVGRAPALVEVREWRAAPEAGRIEERYLRVCLSTVARLGAVQEVVMLLEGGVVTESPRPGVFDPTLLKRMQKLVALLEASSVSHIDFGLLDRPLDRGQPGDYVERYGVPPTLANFLFYAEPPSTASVTRINFDNPA